MLGFWFSERLCFRTVRHRAIEKGLGYLTLVSPRVHMGTCIYILTCMYHTHTQPSNVEEKMLFIRTGGPERKQVGRDNQEGGWSLRCLTAPEAEWWWPGRWTGWSSGLALQSSGSWRVNHEAGGHHLPSERGQSTVPWVTLELKDLWGWISEESRRISND